jgi:endonuclease/exonuclease/phosphatase family metal-dependent hydrolase
MLKVMTFNLRVDTENDGINRFFRRTDRVLKVIRDESPDVIGFQEDLEDMRDFLRKVLPSYTILGC